MHALFNTADRSCSNDHHINAVFQWPSSSCCVSTTLKLVLCSDKPQSFDLHHDLKCACNLQSLWLVEIGLRCCSLGNVLCISSNLLFVWHCTLLCHKIVVEKTACVFLPSLLLCQCPQWFPAPAHPAGVKLTSLHVQLMYITMFRYNVSRMYYCDCQYCNIMICQCVLAALSPEWCTGNMNELAYLRATSQEVSHHVLVDPFLITLHEMPSQWKRRVSQRCQRW